MKRFKFSKPMVESELPPTKDKLWVDVDESTGKISSIKEFKNGSWESILSVEENVEESVERSINFEQDLYNLGWRKINFTPLVVVDSFLTDVETLTVGYTLDTDVIADMTITSYEREPEILRGCINVMASTIEMSSADEPRIYYGSEFVTDNDGSGIQDDMVAFVSVMVSPDTPQFYYNASCLQLTSENFYNKGISFEQMIDDTPTVDIDETSLRAIARQAAQRDFSESLEFKATGLTMVDTAESEIENYIQEYPQLESQFATIQTIYDEEYTSEWNRLTDESNE